MSGEVPEPPATVTYVIELTDIIGQLDDVADRLSRVNTAASELEKIDTILRRAGIEYPLGARGVADLVEQRDGQIDRAVEAETALGRFLLRHEVRRTTPSTPETDLSPSILPGLMDRMQHVIRQLERALSDDSKLNLLAVAYMRTMLRTCHGEKWDEGVVGRFLRGEIETTLG